MLQCTVQFKFWHHMQLAFLCTANDYCTYFTISFQIILILCKLIIIKLQNDSIRPLSEPIWQGHQEESTRMNVFLLTICSDCFANHFDWFIKNNWLDLMILLWFTKNVQTTLRTNLSNSLKIITSMNNYFANFFFWTEQFTKLFFFSDHFANWFDDSLKIIN